MERGYFGLNACAFLGWIQKMVKEKGWVSTLELKGRGRSARSHRAAEQLWPFTDLHNEETKLIENNIFFKKRKQMQPKNKNKMSIIPSSHWKRL